MNPGSTLLDLDTLPQRCVRLAPNKVRDLVDAAAVVLDHFHQSPKPGRLLHTQACGAAASTTEYPVILRWPLSDQQCRQTHANGIDATEEGAYAVAFAAVMSQGYRILRRAHHGSGADYILAKEGEPDSAYRKLEVSGVARGHGDVLMRRLTRKLEQVNGGSLDCPGLALVVGFEAATILAAEQP
jgi:hypothetical protein